MEGICRLKVWDSYNVDDWRWIEVILGHDATFLAFFDTKAPGDLGYQGGMEFEPHELRMAGLGARVRVERLTSACEIRTEGAWTMFRFRFGGNPFYTEWRTLANWFMCPVEDLSDAMPGNSGILER